MALFQPTNITPSSFIDGVVDAETDIAQISWQVNGNSAMTAFAIKFYQNNTDSTVVASINYQKVTGGFYGTDRFGQPQMYTWTADDKQTWSAFNAAFTNGSQFKFKITQYWQENGEEKSIEQMEYSVFFTRNTPECKIQRSDNESFTNVTDFPSGSTLPASIGYFVGNYTQAQGAPVREVRWQVATWVNGAVGDIIADTGDVDTPTLQYTFNGFFIGSEYAIRCSGKADYQTYGTQDFDSGWVNFIANIAEQSQYFGEFKVQCLPKENATLLEWESAQIISPTLFPDEYSPAVADGAVTMLPNYNGTTYSVEWNKKNGSAMNFSQPWTAVWKGKSQLFAYSGELNGQGQLRGTVSFCVLNPKGTILVAVSSVDDFDTAISIYSVSKDKFTFVKEISPPRGYSFANGTPSNIAFSPDGKLLVLCCISRTGGGYSYLYSVDDTTSNISVDFVSFINDKQGQMCRARAAAFSPDGKTLVLGGNKFATVFSVESNTVTYSSNLKLGADEFDGDVYSVAFSPNGKILAVSGTFKGHVVIYSVDGGSISFVTSIKKNASELQGTVTDIVFSSNGELLAVSGNLNADYTSIGALFSVDGNAVKYLYDIKPQAELEEGQTVKFSNAGDWLLVGVINFITPQVHLYTISGTQTLYTKTISPPNGIADMSVYTEFSIDDREFLCGGAIFNTYNGELFQLQCADGTDITLSDTKTSLTIAKGEEILGNFNIDITESALILLTPSNLYIYTEAMGWRSKEIVYKQSDITSVAIFGDGGGSIVDCVSLYQGNGTNVLPLYQNDTEFEPLWNVEEYSLYMTANFNRNLEGGTVTEAPGSGFRIYRQEVGSNLLIPIASIYSGETMLKDFGIRSRKTYKYSLYVYDKNGAFMQSAENDTEIFTNFNSYSLLVCDYDRNDDSYHVRKQYLFALNLSDGAVSNNNTPTLNANFTAYPTRMPSTQNYASGTLQGLIGAIYTVPALVEQIGGFRHTAKASTLDYFDNVDLEKELYDLSTAPYQLFLRDMKGHLRMVATNGAITMTQELKKRQLSTTISLSWVEIGDASDVTIIQTPDDYGWNNDNQVLDVSLDVDPTTGVLTANYPKPYEGTRFYLTGANKEILGAKTPIGVMPAQFGLSGTATRTDDGTLTATVKTNMEEGD